MCSSGNNDVIEGFWLLSRTTGLLELKEKKGKGRKDKSG